jgi:hypothetical protein
MLRRNLELEVPYPCDIDEKSPSISRCRDTSFGIIERLTLDETSRITERNQRLSAG